MVTVFISVSLDMKRRVVDCFLFYNEVDMLDYRLSVRELSTRLFNERSSRLAGKRVHKR